MNPAKRHEIFSRLRAQNPEPRTELAYQSSYELLVAVVLSAQATDKSVNLATAKLFPVANTPQKIVALGEAKVTGYIRTIGLFRTKAKNVVA
ncbi:MAG: endonuclease III, partial [Proteobacteria bacterium]|nr:endonuclease III [Pseudomonadota bacterium]